MKARVLETCERCKRIGYDFRHVVLAIDGHHSLDTTLCKPCAYTVERAVEQEQKP